MGLATGWRCGAIRGCQFGGAAHRMWSAFRGLACAQGGRSERRPYELHPAAGGHARKMGAAGLREESSGQGSAPTNCILQMRKGLRRVGVRARRARRAAPLRLHRACGAACVCGRRGQTKGRRTTCGHARKAGVASSAPTAVLARRVHRADVPAGAQTRRAGETPPRACAEAPTHTRVVRELRRVNGDR